MQRTTAHLIHRAPLGAPRTPRCVCDPCQGKAALERKNEKLKRGCVRGRGAAMLKGGGGVGVGGGDLHAEEIDGDTLRGSAPPSNRVRKHGSPTRTGRRTEAEQQRPRKQERGGDERAASVDRGGPWNTDEGDKHEGEEGAMRKGEARPSPAYRSSRATHPSRAQSPPLQAAAGEGEADSTTQTVNTRHAHSGFSTLPASLQSSSPRGWGGGGTWRQGTRGRRQQRERKEERNSAPRLCRCSLLPRPCSFSSSPLRLGGCLFRCVAVQ